MKRGRGESKQLLLAAATMGLAWVQTASAVPLTWIGGTGTWDLNTTANWNDADSNPVQWTDNSANGADTATFQGAAGTVTMNSTLSALGLTFQTTNYTVSGTGTLTLGSAGIDASALSSGTTILGVNTSLAANQTWTIGSGSAVRVNSVLSGSGGLAKSGNGTLAINATSSYLGNTTLNAGTINNAGVDASRQLGSTSGQLIINGGAISNSASGGSSNFQLNGSSQLWAGDFSISSPNGSTKVTLSSAGGITLTGDRIVSTSGSGSASAGIFINGGPISDGGNGRSLTWAGNGGGRVFLNSAASTYSGATTITGSNILFTGNVLGGSNSAFGNASSDITLGATSGSASAGILVNAASSTFNRNIVVQSGGSGTISIGTINSDTSAGNGTLNLQGNLTLGTGTTAGRNVILHRANVSGNISDPVGLTGTPGVISITPIRAYNNNAESGFSTTLSGNNTFTGGVNLTNTTNAQSNSTVTLVINSATALGTGPLTIGAAANNVAINSTAASPLTLTTDNAQTWNSDFTFTGGQSLNMGEGAVSLGVNAGATRTVTTNGSTTLTIGGAISNGTNGTTPTINLTKAGPGTLALGGASTYTGNTTVNAGTLTLASTGSLTFDVNDGGPSNKITGTGTVTLDGILRLDVAGVTDEGTWTLIDVGTLNETYGGTFGLLLAGSNTPFNNLGGGSYGVTSGGFTWSFDQTSGVLSAAVPEPATFGAIGLAMAGLIARRRRTS